jgi:hypothetical protein
MDHGYKDTTATMTSSEIPSHLLCTENSTALKTCQLYISNYATKLNSLVEKYHLSKYHCPAKLCVHPEQITSLFDSTATYFLVMEINAAYRQKASDKGHQNRS